jgi:hypothetical protein
MSPITSKTQVDRLGERLRRSEVIDTDDLQILQAIRQEYAGVLAKAQTLLSELGMETTPRLKTVNTTIEKLGGKGHASALYRIWPDCVS